jgi:hypothetical protein
MVKSGGKMSNVCMYIFVHVLFVMALIGAGGDAVAALKPRPIFSFPDNVVYFKNIKGFLFDKNNNMFVLDNGNGRVLKLDESFNQAMSIKIPQENGAGSIGSFTTISKDDNADIYISAYDDSVGLPGAFQIFKLTNAGDVVYNKPNPQAPDSNMTVDKDGNIYLFYWSKYQLNKYDTNLESYTAYATGWIYLFGINSDTGGNIYI